MKSLVILRIVFFFRMWYNIIREKEKTLKSERNDRYDKKDYEH